MAGYDDEVKMRERAPGQWRRWALGESVDLVKPAREADVARWNFKAALAWSELAESDEWKPCMDEYVRQAAREKKSKKPRAEVE